MDLLTIMDFDLLADDTNLVNWRSRYEQSVIEGKHYIIKFKPKSILGGHLFDTPCIMRFKFLEDYEKMKKLEEKLVKIIRNMNNQKQPFNCGYQRVKDFVNDLYKEMLDLEEFVKKCNVLKVDYDDGRFYAVKFFGTNSFLAEADHEFRIFNRFLKYLREEEYVDVYEMLKYDIIPTLLKNDSFLQGGLKNYNSVLYYL